MEIQFCCQHEENMHRSMSEVVRMREQVQELTELLNEATHLLFVEGGKPTRKLFGWWFRRDYERKQKKAA